SLLERQARQLIQDFGARRIDLDRGFELDEGLIRPPELEQQRGEPVMDQRAILGAACAERLESLPEQAFGIGMATGAAEQISQLERELQAIRYAFSRLLEQRQRRGRLLELGLV